MNKEYLEMIKRKLKLSVIPYKGKYAAVFIDEKGNTRLLVNATGPYKPIIYAKEKTCWSAINSAKRFSFSSKNCIIV